jgi:uncharacterized membrane-anchored protein
MAKALSTALGEAASDYLVHAMPPEVAVLLGFAAFGLALRLQLRQRRYVPWVYWLTVAMVGVFGTMAADVLHVGLHVPYIGGALLYAVVLTAVFVAWQRTEGTLSIHAIDSRRREVFYWAAVVGTFAAGTAVGDLFAVTLHLGYAGCTWLFAGLILLPGAWRIARPLSHPVAVFWIAYVLTRPLGASVADWLGKPSQEGGVGVGSGPVALVLAVLLAVVVALIAARRAAPASGPIEPAEGP